MCMVSCVKVADTSRSTSEVELVFIDVTSALEKSDQILMFPTKWHHDKVGVMLVEDLTE